MTKSTNPGTSLDEIQRGMVTHLDGSTPTPHPPTAIPSWYLTTFRVRRNTHLRLQNIDAGLRRVADLAGVDPRLRSEIACVQDALALVKINLSLIDRTARRVLDEIVERKVSGTP